MARTTGAERVLLIDDDLMSREVLSLLLASEGFSVETCASGDAAVAYLGSISPPPTIILADMQMPGLSGATLAHTLRQLCSPPAVLVGMSGSDPGPAASAAYDAFLLKPFQPRHLAEAVRAYRRPRPTSERSQPKTPGFRAPREAPATSNPPMSAHTHHQGLSSNPPLPVSSSTPASPELDERIFRQLHEAMPGRQLRQMYTLCVDDVRNRIADMRSLATRHDSEQFVRQAHAIKGGCGMLGASELYSMAARLERSGLKAAGLDDNTAVNPLDELSAACDRLERILGTRT